MFVEEKSLLCLQLGADTARLALLGIPEVNGGRLIRSLKLWKLTLSFSKITVFSAPIIRCNNIPYQGVYTIYGILISMALLPQPATLLERASMCYLEERVQALRSLLVLFCT
jgi:hypothetical protein